MVKNAGFLIGVFIMVVDTLAGILGIEAEITQNKVKHSKLHWAFKCREPSHKAFQLGLAAAILLAIVHFVANLFGGCTCIWSKEDYRKATPNKQLAVVFLLFSWNIGKFKIKKVVWDCTQSHFVYGRDSLLSSWIVHNCLLRLRQCRQKRKKAEQKPFRSSCNLSLNLSFATLLCASL
ncbi:uncharacterized protein LOC122276085 isoform X1 [Carya illinoinensis]|uniref:uncharacterized protein LOC122276085 isoform X1 n=1 Tax=Carya illinoinensis TaxID=32201 RepID=UPI001C71E071|nr:uncharacterized protein LOC122276085 isoform X1 [Carya illinoinensis]